MAASTHAKGRATAAFEALQHCSGGNLICQIVHHSVTADLSANDVIQMIKVPNGAVVTGGWITMDSTNAFTYEVGDGADTNRFVTSSSVSGSQTNKNFVRDLSSAIAGVGHAYTADDTIDCYIRIFGNN